MDRTDTRQRLDRITDPGLFEELATAVLRELDLRCRLLAHVGTNPEGRTVSSSLDGITYLSDEGGRRMVAVHHTIQRNLRPKWLSEPDGDIPKTIDVFRRKKNRIPELRATLILTTNREPREELVHEVEAAGYQAGIDIEIYPGSVIAHFLDTEPKGQWLRKNYLGVSQTTLSEELLRELSVRSIDEELPNAESWVSRAVDEQLAIHSLYPVSFIVGESGMGKTVACLKCLQDYVEGGGSGLLVDGQGAGRSTLGCGRDRSDAAKATPTAGGRRGPRSVVVGVPVLTPPYRRRGCQSVGFTDASPGKVGELGQDGSCRPRSLSDGACCVPFGRAE